MDDTDDMDDLISRVHDLPPELFSRIYELVTAVDSELIIDITAAYRPPAIIQLDHSSREALCEQYYSSGTIFRFETAKEDVVLQWLGSVPVRFRSLIDRIEVGHAWKRRFVSLAYHQVERVASHAYAEGLVLDRRVFYARYLQPYCAPREPETTWCWARLDGLRR
ncbi:hypothetical protein CKM354_000482900 [Cercospora kikuchii]|uniref:F-box domain-containing protein n=1 Tax=Cercospora kikuchii TaxID=84275 RepID=A0A9P3CHK5_9PEZI|nr:uncharacterized protein CKM354_000482900 [Cercospora kikuchii]GIZ41527.1 hypothetical protein CKM354_000482900 [Cercospora kikuchii]